MQTITFMNEKGGTGKTTLAGNLAVGLALKGYRTLAIDSDGQGDLSLSMGLEKAPNFYEFVKRQNRDIRELMLPVSPDVSGAAQGKLFCITGNNESWGLPMTARTNDIVSAMVQRFKILEKIFQYVVIDTQPSATALHDALTIVSNHIVSPTDPELFAAMGGLPSTIQHVEFNYTQSQGHGWQSAQMLAVIPNKYRETALHRQFVAHLKEQYGDLVWDAMPLRVAVGESQLAGTFLVREESGGFMWDFVERVVKATSGVTVNG